MIHQDGTFKDAQDNNIYYQCWLPEGDPKAVMLVVHGLAEHSGRYMNIVNHFVPSGWAVYGIDHFGHGKSDGTRVFVERFQKFPDTVKLFFDMVREWQPEKQVFLTGHSMGGLIGASYLLEHQNELAGAVISAPSVKIPDDISAVTISMGKILSKIIPKAGIIKLDAAYISKDPEVVKAYNDDPLVYNGKITARLAAELLAAMKNLADQAQKITLPLLLVQGSADKMVDPDGARFLFDLVTSEDKEIKIYDGFYHEVFNEPEKERVLKDVEMWLERHLGD